MLFVSHWDTIQVLPVTLTLSHGILLRFRKQSVLPIPRVCPYLLQDYSTDVTTVNQTL